MNEQNLIEKLRLIEALFSGTTIEGEKVAAELARERIVERLQRMEKEEPLIEYRFTMADMWSRKVFVALLRRYEIRPYRYHRQRYTTVMAKVSKRFVDETLWPEFEKISATLREYLSDITDRVVSQVIHHDSSEAEVVGEKVMLTADDGTDAGRTEPAPPTTGQSGQNTGSADTTAKTSPQGRRRKKSKSKRAKKKRR